MTKNDGSDETRKESNKYIVIVKKSTNDEEETFSCYEGSKNKSGITNIEKFGIHSTFILSLASFDYIYFSSDLLHIFFL